MKAGSKEQLLAHELLVRRDSTGAAPGAASVTAQARTAAGTPSVGSNALTVGAVGLTVSHALAWRFLHPP